MKVRAKDLSKRLFRIQKDLSVILDRASEEIEKRLFDGVRSKEILCEIEDLATILGLVEDPDDLQTTKGSTNE